MKRFSCIILFVFSASCFRAQVETITVENGLSNRDVTCILQTQNGYMWFGTLNGLNRYDGYTIQEFNHDNEKKNTLSNGKINCLYEDKKQLLWIGTENGLNILNQRTGELKILFGPDSSNNKEATNTSIHSIAVYHDGSLLVGTGSGKVLKFNDEKNYETFFHLDTRNYNYNAKITLLLPQKDSSVWIMVNHQKIYKYNKDGTRDAAVVTNWIKEPYAFLIPDYFKNIAIAVDKELLPFNTLNGQKIHHPFIDSLNKIYHGPTALMLSNKELWIGYNNDDLIKINLKSHTIKDYSGYIKQYITGAPRIIYENMTGVIWIGTNYGVIKFSPKTYLFENYLSVSPDESIAKKYSIRGMTEDEKGNIYIGSYKGLFLFDTQKKSFQHFTLTDYKNKVNEHYSTFALLNDTNGYIWIGSEGHGFYRLNKKTGKFEFPAHTDPQNNKNVRVTYSIEEVDKNVIYLGTADGLFIYNKTKNSLKKYENKNDKYDIGKVEIMDIAKKNENEIWLGSYNTGIFKLVKNKGVTEHYSISSKPALSHNSVTDLHFDADGILWIGTRGGGLNKLDTEGKIIEQYSKKNGLADDIIAGIEEADNNILWISTFNGLSSFGKEQEEFHNYFEKDGLTENEFNIAAHLKTRGGKIYMGGLNGVNVFYPSWISKKNKKAPLLYFTKIMRPDENGESVETFGDLSFVNEITLSHNNKLLSFYFALADYYNQSGNKFSYILEGYDKDWNNLGTENNVRFTSLPSGNYILKIKGFNTEGIASANQLMVHIYVNKAFYAQVWFIALITMLLAGIVSFIIRYKLQQQMKLQQLRTKISSDLHDEVGSILTRISVQAELIKQGIANMEENKEELQKISQESSLATSTMSDVLWSIDARNDKMGNLIDHMREHASEMLSPQDIEIDFRVENINTEKEIDIAIRQNLFLIFKESINNTAKHSNAKKITIRLKNHNKKFSMMIKDNGNNTTPENKIYQKGQGLKNMKMRAENMEADITINNSEGYCIVLSRKIFC